MWSIITPSLDQHLSLTPFYCRIFNRFIFYSSEGKMSIHSRINKIYQTGLVPYSSPNLFPFSSNINIKGCLINPHWNFQEKIKRRIFAFLWCCNNAKRKTIWFLLLNKLHLVCHYRSRIICIGPWLSPNIEKVLIHKAQLKKFKSFFRNFRLKKQPTCK